MFGEEEAAKPSRNEIVIGCDLSTFSLEDIDERVDMLEAEINRLKKEKKRKSTSLDAAEEFFKKG